MPAPSESEGRASPSGDGPPRDPGQRMRDASDLFEGHLAGLAKAFHLLQQQSFDLLQVSQAPRGLRCYPCAAELEKDDLIFEPLHSTEVLLQAPRLSERFGLLTASSPLAGSDERSIWGERHLRAQFEKLADPPEKQVINCENLGKILSSFREEDEFEDLQAMIFFLEGKDPQNNDNGTAMHHHRSHAHQSIGDKVLGGLGIRRGSTDMTEGLNYEAFRRLRKGEEFSAAPSSVKRDIDKIRSALHAWELQALFGEEDKQLEEPEYAAPSPRLGRCLEILPAIVIVLNSAIFAFQEIVPTPSVWETMEVVFMICYLLEAGVKFAIMGCRGYFLGPEWAWNWFDFLCLFFSVLDFAITQAVNLMGDSESVDLSMLMLLKMLRLARLFRLVRALRYPIFRELNMMVMGVVSGVRVLTWAIVLLVVFIYIVGVACNRLLDAEEEFKTLPAAMFTLFRCFTDGCTAYDGTPLQERLREKYGALFFIAYILTFMLVTVGIFNLIMAIFIDNVMTSQKERKQRDLSETVGSVEIAVKEALCRLLSKQSKSDHTSDSKANHIPASVLEEIQQLEQTSLSRKAKVRAQFQCIRNADVVISRDAFVVWLADEDFVKLLEDADIDITNKSMLFDIMDADMGGSLSTEEVFRGLMQLRGPVSKGDIIAMGLRVTHIAQVLQEFSQNGLNYVNSTVGSMAVGGPRRISYRSDMSLANENLANVNC